jgi:hypothetical protein
MLKYQSRSSLSHTKATFKALVDAVVPEIPETAEKQSSIHSFGALDYSIDEYQIWSLNNSLSLTIFRLFFKVDLAKPVAKMLDKAAKQLIKSEGNKEPIKYDILREKGPFAALAPNDRLRAITLLEQLKVNLFSLPIPFWNNPGFIVSTIDNIIMFCTIGYYSGWSGYSSTCTETPERRKVKQFPTCWKQVQYPGPAKGYHAFKGYLLYKFTE